MTVESSKARNTSYDTVLHGYREHSALTTKNMFPVSYDTFFENGASIFYTKNGGPIFYKKDGVI